MRRRDILHFWNDFWYEWHYPEHIRYGGGPQGYKTFRSQRLYNILILIIVLIALYKIF